MNNLLFTRGINESIANSKDFALFVIGCLSRYYRRDWGDLCEEDKKMNDSAAKNGDDRIVARYNNVNCGDIYIITERDNSATTILFTNEY